MIKMVMISINLALNQTKQNRPIATKRDDDMTYRIDPRLRDAVYRTDFPTFVGKCFHTLVPGSAYWMNWHILALAYHLELVRLGRIRRLIINLPPRSLKSLITSVAFPAFVLGHDPAKRIIVVSYGADLAIKLANDCRVILNAQWFHELFPATTISRTKNTEYEVVTTRLGYRLATSVDGTLTGRGGDVLIVDDPLKPIDALSDNKRERVNDFLKNTLLSRLDDKKTGAVVIVMQRLHMDDLTGTLLRDFQDDWVVLNLPAIAEQEEKIQIGENKYHTRRVGDLLHAEREPQSILDSLRAQLGSDTFAAQYQQAPFPPDGAMIKRDWVQRYEQAPKRESSINVIQSWDTASKAGGQNDYSVCTTWLHHDNKYYLIDVLRGRFDYPTLKAQAILYARAHKPDKILIEDAGVGTALVRELQDAGLTAIGVKPMHDKLTRMSIQSGKFASGRVFFPHDAPWLADFESELFAFPNGRHDDQVDSVSQALAHEISGYNLDGFARRDPGFTFGERYGIWW
jgi:predicted phage terminase large subunit-like protein